MSRRSYIISVTSANVVEVHDSQTRATQGATTDPIRRNFRDTIDDDLLRTRITGYTLRNRTWEPLPLTNMGRVMPGWMFTAVRGEGTFYYTQLIQTRKYLAGYHNAGFQINDDIKDAIQYMGEFPNRLVLYCTTSVYGGPTNTSIPYKIPGTGEFINTLTGVQLLDGSLGVIDYGSVKNIDIGKQIMRCNDDSIRIFDGFKFGPNLAEDDQGFELVMDQLRSWQSASAAGYRDGVYFIWGRP